MSDRPALETVGRPSRAMLLLGGLIAAAGVVSTVYLLGRDTRTSPGPVLPPTLADLGEYTRHVPGEGVLTARIATTLGSVRCELFADVAPITVANFIGLATGRKRWVDPRTKRLRVGVPFYDGLPLQAQGPGSAIQSGDEGGPGYTFSLETTRKLTHTAMALVMIPNGHGTSGSQFAIRRTAVPHLDGTETIFGRCLDTAVAARIGAAPTMITKLTIERGTLAADPVPVEPDPVRAPVAADLATYTSDLPGTGPLLAAIETSLGTFHCELYGDKTPIAVANFVGLATGKKVWRHPTTQRVMHTPFYDGLTFHRVIPGFMVQGGDPLGRGIGGPGYTFNDEVVPDLRMRPGVLAMANAGSGPNGSGTNGSQFFITEVQSDHLNDHHTIFGQCAEVALVTKIARVPRDASDKPLTAVTITRVTISRQNR